MKNMHKFVAAALLLCLAASVASCKGKKRQAIDYNNRIVDLHANIATSILDFLQSLNSNDTAAMEVKHEEMLAVIEDSLIRVRSMEPYEDNSEFRDNAIRLFEFYQDVSTKEYIKIIEIKKKGPPTLEDAKKMNELRSETIEKEKKLHAEFIMAQEVFARKYEISLMSTDTQMKINNF
jgi:hypothetical protein